VSTTAAIEVRSPFTGELVGEAPVSSPSQVRPALDGAAAYENELSRHGRSELRFAVAGRLSELAPELATLISRESGLCLKDARHEVRRAVDVFRFAAMGVKRAEPR